jgi:hypothetical protein
MHTREQAEEAIQQYLSEMGKSYEDPLARPVLMSEFTKEYSFGWVFGYNSRGWLENQISSYLYAGNSPLIFDRVTGQIFPTGTALPLEHYIGNFIRFGHPSAHLGPRVTLKGAKALANKSAAIKLIREAAAIGMAEAKAKVDRVFSGWPVEVRANTPEAAEQLANQLNALGIETEQNPEIPGTA